MSNLCPLPAANMSIANSGAGRWSNRRHIACRFGSAE